MDKQIELLPCPICGLPVVRNGRLGAGGVKCVSGSHLVQSYGRTQAEADEAWNTRHSALSTVNVDALREAHGWVPDQTTLRACCGLISQFGHSDEETETQAIENALIVRCLTRLKEFLPAAEDAALSTKGPEA